MENINTNTKHRKGQHLTYENRVEIEIRLKDGWSKYKIAKHLGCSYNTIRTNMNEERCYYTKANKSVTKHQKVKKFMKLIAVTAEEITD